MDRQFFEDVGTGLKDAAYRGFGSMVGGPVDLATMAMRPFGYSTPENQVVGSSEWIGQRMQDAGLVSSSRNPLAEFMAAVLIPAGMMRAGPALYSAERRAVQNLNAPRTLGKQSGALYVPLSDEIEAARQAVGPRSIQFDDGRTVTITPERQTLLDRNLSASVSFGTPNSSISQSVPSGFQIPQSISSSFFRTPDEAAKVIGARREVSAAKNSLSDYIEAQRALAESVPKLSTPGWVDDLTSSPLSKTAYKPAGEEWWKAAIKDKTRSNYEQFAESARGTNLMSFGGASKEKDFSELARRYSLNAEAKNNNIKFTASDGGTIEIIGANTETPFIRSLSAESSGKKEGQGKRLYQAALEWAANNGKVVKPDPAGISDINELRKLGNALSSQIRTGKAFVEMNSGDLSGIASASEIWKAEAKMAAKRVPAIKKLQFDGSSFNMKDGDIIGLISENDKKFSKGVGLMTAKRAAVSRWMESGVSSDDVKKAAAALIASGAGPIFAMDEPANPLP